MSVFMYRFMCRHVIVHGLTPELDQKYASSGHECHEHWHVSVSGMNRYGGAMNTYMSVSQA